MNTFPYYLIPQSLNSQFLNLAPYSNYDEDGVPKLEFELRSNNELEWLSRESNKFSARFENKSIYKGLIVQ